MEMLLGRPLHSCETRAVTTITAVDPAIVDDFALALVVEQVHLLLRSP